MAKGEKTQLTRAKTNNKIPKIQDHERGGKIIPSRKSIAGIPPEITIKTPPVNASAPSFPSVWSYEPITANKPIIAQTMPETTTAEQSIRYQKYVRLPVLLAGKICELMFVLKGVDCE